MSVDIKMLGRFEVLADGERCPADPWRRKHAAALVKVLALARHRSMHREQLIDLLWPDLSLAESAPRLHKAAHYARRGLPDPSAAVVLRGDMIVLLPDAEVTVDALEFERAAADALQRGTPASAAAALDLYGGTLLPEDLYEPWTEAARDRLSALYQQLLRQAGRWEQLVELDPVDEEAHVALIQAHLDKGDRTSALRQYERMDRALRQELGIGPGREAAALRDRALADLPAVSVPRQRAGEQRLLGRDAVLRSLRGALDEVAAGAGRTVLLSGPPGVGKTTVLDWLRAEAAGRGWRCGEGAAATIEGAWPYAPVLEAIADLCRAHPVLLDGVDDRYRSELDRALSLRDVTADGDHGHQHLFVAAGALLAVAAAGTGVVLLVDDAHEADDASLRLLHYLARQSRQEPVLIVVAYRDEPGRDDQLAEFRTSLGRREGTVALSLEPLDRTSTETLVRSMSPELSPESVEQVWELSAGLPFAAAELARAAAAAPQLPLTPGAGAALTAWLPPPTRDLLARVAVAGLAFDTDEFVALSGLPDELAYARLESALAARILDRTETGYRFRHALLREDILAQLPAHRRAALHRDAATRLAGLGASPARIGHHLVAAGAAREAVPYLLAAARTEAAVGAYRDALALLDAVRSHATGAARAEIAALRGDLLGSLGAPGAVEAYRDAVRLGSGELRRRSRAGLARAATYSGDFATAEDALAGLELNGGPNDAAVLLARGNLAYFRGDLDAAWSVSEQARDLIVTGDEQWQLLDLVALQGLVAHTRGEWFERLSLELQHGRNAPQVAAAVFDSHLCVAEYLLYGPTPYPRVIELARALRDTAHRAGVMRAVAFATALLGEAALLSGALDIAETELTEAVDLHRDIGARAGEAHCLQRLAEVRLARGDRPGARELCERALPLARWSAIAMHLLQRVYGTLIAAADDPAAARDEVGRAEATLGEADFCSFCAVMLAVPAAAACADAGDLAAAQRHLDVAERSAGLWDGTAWQGAICEARAHLARAHGDVDGAVRLLHEAERIFSAAGQPLDARRCRLSAEHPAGPPVPAQVAPLAQPRASSKTPKA
ncbi:MAG TPA: AAA family ATPase [Actinomycetes bacterium]